MNFTLGLSTDAYRGAGLRVALTFSYAMLMLVGLLGNGMVILVVLCVKQMLTPTNCYLVSLAVSDMLFFLSAGPVELGYLNLPRAVYPFGHLALCKLMTYAPYLAINASSMTIAAFTLERYVGICHPMKARYLCTISRAVKTIAVIWVIAVLSDCPWLLLATLKPVRYLDLNASSCTFALDRQSWKYKLIFFVDFVAFYLIPMIFYGIFYGKIAITLTGTFEENAQHAPRSSVTKALLDRHGEGVGKRSSAGTLQVSPSQRRESVVSGNNKRIQVVRMLFVIVAVFATCWLPYRALVLYNSFSHKPWVSEAYIYMAKTLIFINCAINPVLYNVMSARFREAFANLLRRGCKRHEDPNRRTSYSISVSHRRASLAATPELKTKNGSQPKTTSKEDEIEEAPAPKRHSVRWMSIV